MSYHYRITKYNPLYRVNGAYQKDEWTCYRDIGCTISGKVLTKREYLKTELNYLKVIYSSLKITNIEHMVIRGLEIHEYNFHVFTLLLSLLKSYYKFGWLTLRKKQIIEFCRACLRDELWGKLEYQDCYIHFGWDYYMYLGVNIKPEVMQKIASKNHMFCEIMESPH